MIPDLIILDINMPILGGIAVAKEIKTFLPNVSILLFSLHDSHQLIREAKTLGARGFVNKGQAGAMLLNAMDAIIGGQTFFSSIAST